MSKSFNQITEANNSLMIVDALNLGFRWKHAGDVHFSTDYIRTVQSLQRSYRCSHVIIASDMGSSSYRKAIYPEYKQNRKDKYETQTEQEKQEFEEFFREMVETLDEFKRTTDFPVLRFQGVEADDLAAYLSRKYYEHFDNIWLISSDRDWDLLVNDKVSRWSYVTRKEFTYDNWGDHYDYSIDQYLSVKAIMGDSGDNIPGVEGVGPKRALNLVQEYGDIFEVIAALPINSKYKYISNLNAFGAEALMRNLQLIDLQTYCTEAIGEDNLKIIDKITGDYIVN